MADVCHVAAVGGGGGAGEMGSRIRVQDLSKCG